MPTLLHFIGNLGIFATSPALPHFTVLNLPHSNIIIGNIGDMMRGNVNTLTVDTIKVPAQKIPPAF